ncbi:hypothetical protein LTR27_003799 [Elasticomyces elasticus]|nr:hypothetical protein LTR27_003799 [Elasticomyces elasticus]
MLANATKCTPNAFASRTTTTDKRSWKESPSSHHISVTMNDLALAGAIGTPFLVAFTLILCYCCFCLDRKPNRLFFIQKTKKGILPTHHPPGMFNHYEWGPFINTGNGNFHSGPDKPSPSHTSKTSSIRCGHRRSRRGSRCDHGIHISATYGDQAVRDERPPQPAPAPIGNDNAVLQAVADLRALVAGMILGGPRQPDRPLEPVRPPRPHSDIVSEISSAEMNQATYDALQRKAMAEEGSFRSVSPFNEWAREDIRRKQRAKKERRRSRERERRRRESRGR